MRIVTWNINGISTVVKHHPWYGLGSHQAMLDEMGADIYCFQEHKITRKKLERSMAIMDKYDAFFSFYRPNPNATRGYSGTVVYTKKLSTVPIKAEEGLSGILFSEEAAAASFSSSRARSSSSPASSTEDRVGHYPAIYSDDFPVSPSSCRAIDLEGRAVVLDFRLFVLINVYCPAETSEERLPFKLEFNALLEARVKALIDAGRDVIVVGDVNIVSAPIDHADPERRKKDHGLDDFMDHPARTWFKEWVGPQGPLVDTTRKCNPDRRGMFTCWDMKTDARPSNYGTRLDYILVTPGLLPWVRHSDIQPELYGSDHCPVYLDLHDEIVVEGRGKVKLWDEINPPSRSRYAFDVSEDPLRRGEGDPVKERANPDGETGTVRREITTKADDVPPPRFAACWWDEFSSKQKLLSSFFGKKVVARSSSAAGARGDPASAMVLSGSAPQSAGSTDAAAGSSAGKEDNLRSSAADVADGEKDKAEGDGPLLATALFEATEGACALYTDTEESDGDRGANGGSIEPSSEKEVHGIVGDYGSRQTVPRMSKLESIANALSPPTPSSSSRPVSKSASSHPGTSSRPASPSLTSSSSVSSIARKVVTHASTTTKSEENKKCKGKVKNTGGGGGGGGQMKLSSFFAAPKRSSPSTHRKSTDLKSTCEDDARRPSFHKGSILLCPSSTMSDYEYTLSLAEAEAEPLPSPSSSSSHPSRNGSSAEPSHGWQALFSRPPVPRCEVHNEPAKEYTVNKPGPNKGRHFWLCSRPVGPGYDRGRSKMAREDVNSDYRCNFFLWSSNNKRPALQRPPSDGNGQNALSKKPRIA